jgi:hypothetical protein
MNFKPSDFRGPIVDEPELAAFRERNRRLVEALQALNAVDQDTRASEESRRQARADFDAIWGPATVTQ